MNSKKTGLAILGLLLVIFVASKLNLVQSSYDKKITQLPPSSVMSVDEMQEDISYLVDKIKDIHPETYKGVPTYLERVIEEVKGRINEPMTAGEFYFEAATIASALQDAHTSLYYLSSGNNRRINMPLKWLKRSLVVSEDTDTLKIGDEIISIGSKTVPTLFNEMSDFIPAENEGWVRARAETSITQEAILRHLGLLNLDSTVTVDLKRDKEEISVSLPLVDSNVKAPRSNYILTTYYEEMSLAVFRFDQCIYDSEYKDKLKNFFKEVAAKEINNVAIDIRNNTGGNSKVMNELLSYLQFVDEVKSYDMLVRYSKDASSQRTGLWRTNGIKEYNGNAIKVNHKNKDLLFNGKLYMLTSNKTFSSGNWIAVMGYDNEFATIIGEPTGNSPSSFGDVISLKLPNSGYHVSMSYKKFIRPNQDNDPANTLTPHIIVYTVGEDLKNDTDPQMEMLLQLITNNE